MSILGGAWTASIVWYLSGGPRRFGELKLDLATVSANVLTARLRELEARGAVRREVKPTSPPSVEYALSELGRELVPAIDAIVRVGHRLKQLAAERIRPARDRAPPRLSPPAAAGAPVLAREGAGHPPPSV